MLGLLNFWGRSGRPMATGVLALGLLFTTSLTAQPIEVSDKAPDAKGIDAAVAHAVKVLLHNQENYVPDSPVGGLPDDKLEGWQEGERKRLEEIRKESAEKGAREWPYEGVYRVRPDGRIPPGYRVGGTAIVCEALLEAPGLDKDRRKAIENGFEFMLKMISEDEGMAPKKQTNYDVRGWGQAYALKVFLRAIEKDFPKRSLKKKLERAIPHLIGCLETGQVAGGGWNYAGRGVSPFMTGSTLIALYHAKSMGYKVSGEMIESALDALEGARADAGPYAYSGRLRSQEEPMEGSSARSAIAELALFQAGRSDTDRLRKAVDGFFNERNWNELLKRKSQQGTHVRPYGVAPYYFFFGHTYAALAAEHLPEEERAGYRKKMQELLWRTIEGDGAWNDRIFPRTESYSTAMAVLSLIAGDLPKVHAWGAKAKTTEKKKKKGGVSL